MKISPSDAARAMRAVNSEAQQQAARENGKKGGRPKGTTKAIEDFECTCGKCPDNPKTYCPRGRAILRRFKRATSQP